jgi:hypothetical protein
MQHQPYRLASILRKQIDYSMDEFYMPDHLHSGRMDNQLIATYNSFGIYAPIVS